MKITGVEPILAGKRYLFLRLATDSGLIGYGECGAWEYQEATALVLRQMGKMIEGMDPMRIEFIYNALSRNLHFRGSVIQSALSGIDIVLWDLKGKALGVPCYELLGGKTRDKIRVYTSARAQKGRSLIESAQQLLEKGFSAFRYTVTHPKNQD